MRIGIVGLGLIGGSLAGALRSAGHEVLGYDRNAKSTAIAVERGFVDEVEPPERLAADSEVIVLCLPVGQTLQTIPSVGSWMRPEAILTDVASVKRPVLEVMGQHSRSGQCVGGHPVLPARRLRGFSRADPAIFLDAPYAVVPGSKTEARAVDVP